MSKITQKLELVANILIIVVAVLLIGVIAQRYFFSPSTSSNQPARTQPTVGTQIALPDTNWARQPKTLIMVLQKGCRFCNESAPFYRRLQESARNKNVQLVAVLPGKQEESMAYLGELGLANLEVKQAPLNALQVGGTPTLILTNDKGEVTDYWVGMLPPEKESEVLDKL